MQKKTKPSKWLFSGLLTLILVFNSLIVAFAGGGGSGGGTGTGTGSTTPLGLQGAYLATGDNIAGKTNVELIPNIKLVFNKNVTDSSVWTDNSQVITLKDGDNIVDISFTNNSSETQNIYLTPKEPLNYSKTYTLSIDSTLKAKSGDTLGHVETVTFTTIADTVPPALSITTPQNDSTTNNSTIPVSGTTEPGSSVTINGFEVEVDEAGNFAKDISLAEGPNMIYVIATDGSGNTASDEITVTYDPLVTEPPVQVDPVKPMLTVTSPQNLSVTDQSQMAVFGITDPGCTVKVNEAEIAVGEDGSFSSEISLVSGTNSITIISTKGGVSTETVLTVTYIPPSDGNGGGNGGGKSEPLAMMWSSITDGEQGILLKPTIKMVFNKNVVNASVRDNNLKCFTLKEPDGSSVPMEVILADDQTEPDKKNDVVIIPNNDLKPNTTYTLTISSELKAKSGAVSGKEIKIVFTTAGASPVQSDQGTSTPSPAGTGEGTSSSGTSLPSSATAVTSTTGKTTEMTGSQATAHAVTSAAKTKNASASKVTKTNAGSTSEENTSISNSENKTNLTADKGNEQIAPKAKAKNALTSNNSDSTLSILNISMFSILGLAALAGFYLYLRRQRQIKA